MLFLPVFKENIPYQVNYRLEGSTFTFRFYYNQMADYFTVDLLQHGEALVLGEKIVYGKSLFSSYPADDRLPFPAIIPVDLSSQTSWAGWQEMMENVFLYMPTPDDLEEMALEMD